jgi:glycosyltransferase involved in cell wall biosynthesis
MAISMTKLLIVTDRFPGEQMSGGALKTKKLIDYLGRWFDLRVLCLSIDQIGGQSSLPSVTTLPLKSSQFRPSLLNLLMSYAVGCPLSVFRNRTHVASRTYEHLFDWCDMVLIDHFFMFDYIPKNFDKHIVLHQHNAEYVLWSRQAENEKNFLRQQLLNLEKRRVLDYERKISLESDLVLAAPNDILALQRIGVPPHKFQKTLHLGDDSLLATAPPDFASIGPQLCFLGGLNWSANFDSLMWFLEECWDQILEKNESVILNIVGACDAEVRSKLSKYRNLIVHGYVDDLDSIMSQVKVFISPLRYGSGMKVKNITALYKGLPIVTTSVGAEGIEIEDSVHAEIADSPEAFVQRIFGLLQDNEKCFALSVRARELAKRRYSWDSHMQKIRQALDSVVRA